MTPRRIGILGGMGPEATVLLMQKIIAATSALDDADHIPLIVDQNPQVPSRIRFLIEGTGPSPGPVLAVMARRLQAAGAEALAMPCNTAHCFADEISSAADLPFIDMIGAAVGHAATLASGGSSVGILASPAVRGIGLFDEPIRRRGLTPIYFEDDAAMLKAIRSIKSGGPTALSRDILRRASDDLLARGARVQMIACTEFSLIADAVAPGATAFDTLDRLVDAIITFARDNGSGQDKAAE